MFRSKNIFLLVFFVLLSMFAVQPSKILIETVKVDDVSTKNYFAPKSINFEDEAATEKLKQDALSQIQSVYNSDEKISLNLVSDLQNFINSVIEAKQKVQSRTQLETDSKKFNFDTYQKETINSIINPFDYTYDELAVFYNLDERTLKNILDITKSEVQKAFDSKITDENIDLIRKNFLSNTSFYMIPKDTRSLLLNKLAERFEPNLFLNVEETELRKNQALEKIQPVLKVIKKGELIVRVGDVITEEQYLKLQALGMVNNEFHLSDILKQLPFIFLVYWLAHMYLFEFYAKHFNHVSRYAFVLSSLFFVLLLDSLLKDTFLVYVPFITILMIYAMFWGKKFVVFMSVILSLLISSGDYGQLSLVLITGIVLALKFDRKGEIIDFIKSGLTVGMVLFFTQIITHFTFNQNMKFDFTTPSLLLISSLVATGISLILGILSEKPLGLVTSLSLHSLTKPNHPLLRQLIMSASATYQHSVNVANLSEIAAEEIGADGLLLRVAAYFHDVGKMKNPEYFIENSSPESNPHNSLSPEESAKIITEHPLISIELCKQYKIPEPVIELLSSHHGDSLVKHFYNIAKEKNPEVDDKLFRYTTPTPKTREEGILMLADSMEAFSRTLSGKPKEEYEKRIRHEIHLKIQNGELRDCELSAKDIEKIIPKFVEYLSKSNHKRIEYKQATNEKSDI